MKKTLLLALLMVWAMYGAMAQNKVTGVVRDTLNAPLPGVSIRIKGSAQGTTTDVNGQFTLTVDPNATLRFTYTGFVAQEVPLNGRTTLNVILQEDTNELNEVVVTALGIKKERKALGYSVTEVQGEGLTQARETNVMNSLAGKVAGLNITAGAGGPGASNNVLIRGVSTISSTANSQPLYVINGVPMENTRGAQPGGQWDNAPDLGDAVGNINPDDIESISVLKGAAASALYGYRAKAGVIMITTKSGKGNGIEFNSNFVGEQVMDLTDWQYVYGQGSNNIKPVSATAAGQSGGSSWGGLLDGSLVPQFDGVERPYSAVTDNLSKFYRTGNNWTNTVTLNRSFTGGAIRLSASNMDNLSVVPNSSLDRNTFNLAGTFDPINNLKIDARVNYIIEKARNRSMLSDGAGNANYQVMFLPTSLDVNTLKPGWNPDGSELAFNTGNSWATNPWFAAEKFVNDTDRERLISSITARYDFAGAYYIQGRVGRDHYNDTYTNVVPTGTAYRPNGSMSLTNTSFTDMNADVLLGGTFTASDFSFAPAIGAAYRNTHTIATTNNGNDFNVPFVYNIPNLRNKGFAYTDTQFEVQSLYGNVEVSYKDLIYLTGSIRSDWFSTLATPGVNNKLNTVYPGVNTSFVFSELWKPSFLDFGKLRLGYAEVGQATDPYQTQLAYSFLSGTIGGNALGSISNSTIPNASLVASSASEFEIGTELTLFNNLLSLDATWYNKISDGEIIPVTTSTTTGYTGAVLNSGSMRNRGFEALVTARIVRDGKFNWTTSLNGSVNSNVILEMAEGTDALPMGVSRTGVGFIQHLEGLPAFQILAYDYKYDENGNIQYLESGIPDRGELTPQGSAIPKWTAGWNNEFSYKKVNLSFLLEGKWGAKIYSGTDYYGYFNGLHKATLENREGNFAPAGSNTVTEASSYYSNLVQNVSSLNVESADFIKVRQIILGYTFGSLFDSKIKSVNISAVARNPFILMRKTDNIDPEGGYSSAIPGIELGGIPPVRSFGVNLNVKF
ncbi:SusC/RagA family TonB-linked outer membrane protein [Olivibacter sitiensis]|uniref:SusC/RagA family TonB-linked outer membrane protein n=1 Tax=Olivibacter sitiensis TaxID=376470 RepID=UPI0004034E06|nr:SusC/RagA family TonB-linked outer membrane protein [Olivibacter sitiensis]